MEILIIVLLILLNGIFAMAEIAIVSARKSRLRQLASEGDAGAQAALDLSKNPNRFLSTVQVGITLVGIFAGAFGGATLSKELSAQLIHIPLIAAQAEPISFIIVVVAITYLSLIFGELVPKRIGLTNPEKVASFIATPMNFISKVSTPIVVLLSVSTDTILKLFNLKEVGEIPVSEEEVKMLIRQGARTGVFHASEKDIVERTFKLSDRTVNELMSPRNEIVWLNINTSPKTIRNKIARDAYSIYPVCRDSLDKVIGIVHAEDLLTDYLIHEKVELEEILHKPLFIPETMQALKVLELFKQSGIHMALVIDEYGGIQGLIALQDILEAIVGDLPTVEELEEKDIMKRDENSYFVNASLVVDVFKDHFGIKKLPGEKTADFNTIGGFVMYKLGKIPVTGDKFEWEKFIFEVVDMDGNRVDKILVTLKKNEVI